MSTQTETEKSKPKKPKKTKKTKGDKGIQGKKHALSNSKKKKTTTCKPKLEYKFNAKQVESALAAFEQQAQFYASLNDDAFKELQEHEK